MLRALLLALVLPCALGAGDSVFATRPEDPAAVDVTPERFAVKGDGVADDTAALQAAIDRVQETTRRGIVFLPSGRYRVSRALLVWSGIRLIGYGPTRPVLVLGAATPGYQEGPGRYLVHFVSDRPAPGQPVRDANPGTFYSAMSNVDLEIQPGNAAAVGVRAHFAQHCFLSHVDFRIGEGRAGVEEVGNEFSHLRFFGGEFGITTHKPSPSWPFVLLDSEFAGQRRAAIETEEAGLTLVRVAVRDAPTAVLVRPDRSEELSIEDARFERLSGPALVVGREANARTQVSVRNLACADVPTFVAFRETGATIAAPAPRYRVKDFVHGLQFADSAGPGRIRTTSELEPVTAMPPDPPSDLPPLPAVTEWVSVRAHGAVGDGVTDDTAMLQAAIARHRVLYFPSGRYRVTDTLRLRPDSVLIGLSPITTQILLHDFTPAFQGVNGPTERPSVPDLPGVPRAWRIAPPFPGTGAPRALVESAAGGAAIVSGLGLDTGGVNNRAVALKWTAGPDSFVNDVRFLGGHGTYAADGTYLSIYNDNRTADPDPQRRWDSQFPSLWVTAGGGGTFKGIWTPSPFAAAGLLVSDTQTSGRVYALSSEHHVRNEVKLRRVANWRFYALQTEAERGESPQCLPLDVEDCADLLFVNFFAYRVDLAVPYPTAMCVTRSRNIEVRGFHAYSPGKLSYDRAFVDPTGGAVVWAREIARLHHVESRSAPDHGSSPRADPGAPVIEKVAGGFVSIDGLAAAADGGVYFVDAAMGRVHRWSRDAGLSVVTDAIPQPVAVAPTRSGGLLVISRHGNVYALSPAGGEGDLAVLAPRPPAVRPGATVWLPVNRWRDGHDWLEAATRAESWQFVSPDGSVVVPASESYVQLSRPGRRGGGTVDLARTYALQPVVAGRPVFVADEFGQTTWRFRLAADGTLGAPERFAEEGEVGTAADPDGNVYVGAGKIFVYDAGGRLREEITLPERPAALVLGGADARTLFVAARTSLYAISRPAANP